MPRPRFPVPPVPIAGRHVSSAARGATVAAAVLALLALIVAGGALPAGARSRDMQAARAYYPAIVGSAIDNCSLCHVSESNFRLDPYGSDYGDNDEDFAAVEAMDSDGDGYSNLTEIVALTYPGKSDSVPVPTATQSPGPTATASIAPTVSTQTPTTAPTVETPVGTPTEAATVQPTITPEPPPAAIFLPRTDRRG